MKAIGIIGLALSAVCVVADIKFPSINATTRILGGQNAKTGQFPYQALLHYQGKHICGGSIISNWFILTAASCTQEKYYNLNYLRVVVGTVNIFDGGNELSLAEIINHPKYDMQEKYQHDISLLRTAQEITFTDLIKPVALPKYESAVHKDKTVASGWGMYKSPEGDQKKPEILQFAVVEVFDIELCKEYFAEGKVTDYNICTVSGAGIPENLRIGVCNGDKGGPLVKEREDDGKTLVGIVTSDEETCGKDIPDVFTKVYKYVKWIKNEIDQRVPPQTTPKPTDTNIHLGPVFIYIENIDISN